MKPYSILLAAIMLSSIMVYSQDRGGLTALDKKPKSEPDEMTLALKKKLTYDWQLSDAHDIPINGWILSLREDGTFSSGDWKEGGASWSGISPRPRTGAWDVEHGENFKLVLQYSGGSPDLRLNIDFISAGQFKFKDADSKIYSGGELTFSRSLSSKESTNKYHNKGYYFTMAFPWEVRQRFIGSDISNAKAQKSGWGGTIDFNKDMSFKYKNGSNVVESFWTFEVKDDEVYINADKLGYYRVFRFINYGDKEEITLEKQLDDGKKEFLKLERITFN